MSKGTKHAVCMSDLKCKQCSTFNDVLDLTQEYVVRPQKLTSWVFRGQENASWPLKTNLERKVVDFGWQLRQAPDIEEGLLRKFRRHCENYMSNVPDWGNYLEWFALMRHYGAPTRLLDCTYSFFVALFFAVEKAHKDHKGFAVWAFDTDGIDRKACKLLPRSEAQLVDPGPQYDPNLQFAEDFRKVFVRRSKKTLRFVVAMNPYKFNERLVAQQGVFLCPGDISKRFEENLVSMFASSTELNKKVKKYVFKYSMELKKQIIFYLQKMNINRATLFPGLQGFAESLTAFLAFPDVTKVLPKDSEYVRKRYTAK
jgi:hypothetical protein